MLLLVDDDIFLLDLYARKFETKGFSVVNARNGNFALDQLRGGLHPNVIVFDIMMDHGDGLTFLESVKKEGLAPDAVKVVLSNEDADDIKKRATDLGADAYITKVSATPSETVTKVLEISHELHEKRAA